MAERRGGRFSRWTAVAVAPLLALLYVANKPFYSGSSLSEHLSWRMEHGRLTVKRSSVSSSVDFYVAGNSEGLRFAFDGHWWDAGDWSLTLPLWAPLLLTAAWVAWAWKPQNKAQAA